MRERLLRICGLGLLAPLRKSRTELWSSRDPCNQTRRKKPCWCKGLVTALCDRAGNTWHPVGSHGRNNLGNTQSSGLSAHIQCANNCQCNRTVFDFWCSKINYADLSYLAQFQLGRFLGVYCRGIWWAASLGGGSCAFDLGVILDWIEASKSNVLPKCSVG